MPDPDTLIVRIEADLTQFRREIGEVEKLATQTGSNIAGSFRGFVRELSRASKEIKTIDQSLTRLSDRTQKKFAAFSKTGLPVAKRSMVNGAGTRNNRPTISGIQPAVAPAVGAFILNPATIAAIRAVLLRVIEGIVIGVTADQASKLLESSDAEKGGSLKQRIENQIRVLERIKGLNNPVAEVEESSRNLLEQLTDILESSRSRIASLTKQLEVAGDGKGPDFTFGGEGLVFSAKEEKSILRDLIDREKQLIEPLERLAPILDRLIDAPARSFDSLKQLGPLSDCLQLLCDRLESFGQDISIDRASAQPGDARFTLAAFDPADSLLGGAGRDGFGRDLADTAWRVEDLSAGFVELTDAAGDFEVQGGSIAELLGRTNALFGEQSGLLGQLSAQVPELGGAFATLLERTSQEVETLDDAVEVLGQSFLSAFEGAIQSGESLSDVLKGLLADLAGIALKAAEPSLIGFFTGLFDFGGVGANAFGGGGVAGAFDASTFADSGFSASFAKGAAFAPGPELARNIKAFARGGIVDTPQAFAFADGLGIMGEAGPEAILPLARTPSGALGVRAMIGSAPAAAAPAAAGPTFIINAPGADRDGMREVMDFIRFVHGEVVRLDRSIEPRSLRAWVNHRRRGGFR